MKKAMVLFWGMLVLFLPLVWSQEVVPETSSYGTVTVDGDLSDAAWSHALNMPASYYDQESGPNKHFAYCDRTDESDITATFKLMYQGQKFYIGCTATDNELCVWNDPIKDIPEVDDSFTLAQVWQWCTWTQDGMEVYLNLNGPPHSGAPTFGGIGAGDSHVKIGLDQLYEPSIKPAGAQDRWWDYIDVDAASITATFPAAASIGLDINKSTNTHVTEYCIDVSQLSGATPLAEGNHIAFLGYYRDTDTNTNATGGLETPPEGTPTAKFTNLTGYLTKELDLSETNIPNLDASSWGELVLGGSGTGIDEWRLF